MTRTSEENVTEYTLSSFSSFFRGTGTMREEEEREGVE
jgi:hypothetical protein